MRKPVSPGGGGGDEEATQSPKLAFKRGSRSVTRSTSFADGLVRRLSRSSSLSHEASTADPPAQAPAPHQNIDLIVSRLNHVESQLDRLSDMWSSPLALELRSAANDIVRATSERMELSHQHLELLKTEAADLSHSLAAKLTSLQMQHATLLELLHRGPDAMHFPSSSIKLRVGECVFHTSVATLCKDSTSMLAAMFSGKFALIPDAEGCFFIDRDGSLFHHILAFLRSARLPGELSAETRRALVLECEFYGLVQMADALKSGEKPQMAPLERNTMANIQNIATSNYVQSVISSLAEVTQAAFRQMAADAEAGLTETVLIYQVGQLYHEFFVGPDGTPKKVLNIFVELLRQEDVSCSFVAPTPLAPTVQIRCSLLRADKEICTEVLRNFKKMRGFGRVH